MDTLILIGITGLAGYYFSNQKEGIRNISENDPLPNSMPEIEKPVSMNIYDSKMVESANDEILQLSTLNYKDSTLPSVSGVLPPIYNSYSLKGNDTILSFNNELSWKDQSDINAINKRSDINTGTQPNIVDRPIFESKYDTNIANSYTQFDKKSDNTVNSLLSGKPLELEHTNMVPFFGSTIKQNIETFANESKLDTFTGNTSTFIHKKEPLQRFENKPEIGINGTTKTVPIFDVIDKSRFVPSSYKQGEKPFQETHINAPISFTLDNPVTKAQINQPTIDTLRVKNKQQKTYDGILKTGSKLVPLQETIGTVSKNRVITSFELGHDRLFTGPALQTTSKMTENYNNIMPTSRQTQNLEYYGINKATNALASTQRIKIDNT
jgi:hypothetical protein